MLSLGNNLLKEVGELYLGDIPVVECYLGEELVFPFEIQEVTINVNLDQHRNNE